MAQIPAILEGYTCFVDGQGYVGKITRGTPPKLTKSLLEHRAGMPGTIDLFRGYEKMECQFSIREFNPDLVRLMLVYDMSGEAPLLVRMVGAQLYPDGRARRSSGKSAASSTTWIRARSTPPIRRRS